MPAWKAIPHSQKTFFLSLVLLSIGCLFFSACEPAIAPTTPAPTKATKPNSSEVPPATTGPTGPASTAPQWLPLQVEQECKVGNIKIPTGGYQIFPVIETTEGKMDIKKYLLAAKAGVKAEDIDTQTGHAKDGSFAVVINVIGVATLKDPFTATRARFSNNNQIASIWVGLAGDNREWTSEPLNLTHPTPEKKKGKG